MIRIVKRLGCLIGRHEPARRSVHYEGHLKIGPCRYCARELEKRPEGHWAARRAVGRGPILED